MIIPIILFACRLRQRFIPARLVRTTARWRLERSAAVPAAAALALRGRPNVLRTPLLSDTPRLGQPRSVVVAVVPARCSPIWARAFIWAVCLLVVLGLPAQMPAQSCGGWLQRTPATAPQPRSGHAMAYDSARGVTVLFGGLSFTGGENFYRDTWEWNGTTWTQRSTSGPSPRAGCCMAYDSARHVTVLFGGFFNANGSQAFDGDTWEWNGTTWTQRSAGGDVAPPRASCAAAYDSVRGVTVLSGGQSYDGENLGDTWEWDGTTWTQRSATGPSPRYLHAMAYDSARHVSVLFGGITLSFISTYHSDTWEWDGATWTQHSSIGPSPRAGSCMAYDSIRHVTRLFGGGDANLNSQADTWEWDGTLWMSKPFSGPPARGDSAMAYDSSQGKTVLFGGVSGNSIDAGLADTWELYFPPPTFLYVDWRNFFVLQLGTQERPFRTVRQAVNASVQNTTITIETGDYAEGPITFTQCGTVQAVNGSVHIH